MFEINKKMKEEGNDIDLFCCVKTFGYTKHVHKTFQATNEW